MNYFDLHCDTPYECFVKNQEFSKNNLAVSGENGKAFDSWTQTFAVWINDNIENPFLLYRQILNNFKEKLLRKPDNLTSLFMVEGGSVIEGDVNRINILKNDGIKAITLTWNGENRIAGGCKSFGNLTDFGCKVIERMNNLNIACDLSHLNDKSFFEVIERAKFPIATHSNCRCICDNVRNLTDEQIKLICEKGGIIGVCFYPEFLGGDVPQKIYENIFHLLDMGFENNIAIGSDFDGAEMNEKLNSIKKIPELYQFLSEKSISSSAIDKIFYENAALYYRKL